MKKSQLLEQRRNKGGGRRSGTSPSLHLTVVLSKAALSGPSVCLRARAPCPLRVSCPGADRAESCVLSRSVPCSGSRQAAGSGAPVPHPPGPRGRAARAAGLRSSGWLLGTRQVNSPGAELTHGPATCAPCACLCNKIDIDGVPVFDTGATNLFTVVPTLTVPDRWIFPRIEGG